MGLTPHPIWTMLKKMHLWDAMSSLTGRSKMFPLFQVPPLDKQKIQIHMISLRCEAISVGKIRGSFSFDIERVISVQNKPCRIDLKLLPGFHFSGGRYCRSSHWEGLKWYDGGGELEWHNSPSHRQTPSCTCSEAHICSEATRTQTLSDFTWSEILLCFYLLINQDKDNLADFHVVFQLWYLSWNTAGGSDNARYTAKRQIQKEIDLQRIENDPHSKNPERPQSTLCKMVLNSTLPMQNLSPWIQIVTHSLILHCQCKI